MTLLTLTTRYRDDLYFILIEGITLLSYDLDHGWISKILRISRSLFVNLVFVVLVGLEDISCASSLVIDYLSYSVIENRVIKGVISLISVAILYIQSLIAVIV